MTAGAEKLLEIAHAAREAEQLEIRGTAITEGVSAVGDASLALALPPAGDAQNRVRILAHRVLAAQQAHHAVDRLDLAGGWTRDWRGRRWFDSLLDAHLDAYLLLSTRKTYRADVIPMFRICDDRVSTLRAGS